MHNRAARNSTARGVTVREFPARMTDAEAAIAQKAAADVARQRQHDQFLLTTYTAPSDIEQLRDERLALIESQVMIARGSLETLNVRIGALQERLRNFKPYAAGPAARRVPDQLAEEVVRTLQEQRSVQDTIKARETEKQELRARFDGDLARYRELTGKRLPR